MRASQAIFFLLPVLLVAWLVVQAVRTATAPEYAGSESCEECHPREYELWRTSPHAAHIRRARGELPGAVWAIGRTNIVQFLCPMPDGTLQTMRHAWDLRKGEWFDSPSASVRNWIRGDAPLPWTHPAWNFTRSCARCHIVPANQMNRANPGIACEGCHGPLGKHVKAPLMNRPARLGSESCRTCHSKASSSGSGVALLDDIDFTADGRDLGENYTWGTWQMRRCRGGAASAARKGGMECLTCHTSSGRMRNPDNPSATCLSCHRDIDLAKHSHHPTSIPNSELRTPNCVSCHMAKNDFGRIVRSDHSFRPPDPRMAVMYGGKSACAACHDRSEEENARIVESWRPGSPLRDAIRRDAEFVQRALNGDPTALRDLDSTPDPSRPAAIRETLMRVR